MPQTTRIAAYADLRDQTIVITGGANGIGAAMVRAFHTQGAHIHFCDADEKAGSALQNVFAERVSFTRVDLTKENQIVGWIRKIGAPIRTLVNNAARDPRIPIEKTSAKEWDALFATNLRAYFLTARETAPLMKSGGSIINFSSITFHTAPPAMSAYVATKGGALAFTRSLARELGPRGIRVNTISPGWIMTERQLKQFVTPAVKRLIRASQCVPDLLQPQEIAEVALFLASNASRAITGQEILADRGWAHS